MRPPEVFVRTDESHVRKVIQAFTEKGFGSLDPDYQGGRLLSEETLRQPLIGAGLSLLFAHGYPIVGGGKAAFEEFVKASPT